MSRASSAVIVVAMLFASAANAEASSSSVLGYVDLRPSWNANRGKFYGENIAELGYRFTPNLSLSYQQQFYVNLYQRVAEGLDPSLFDGFVRAKFDNVWTSKTYWMSLGYEPRVYLPTDSVKRDRGLVTIVRNYLKYSSRINRDVALLLMEVPIVHAYSLAGANAVANPAFENRVYFGPQVSLFTSRLNLFFPLILSQTRFHDFEEDAVNGGQWSHAVWIYPEVTYQLSRNVAVGVAFESGSFVQPDLSGANFLTGLQKGITQLVFQLSL